LVVLRRRDAQLEPPRNDHSMNPLPPPPSFPHLGCAPPT
jgi:hypothetical protein